MSQQMAMHLHASQTGVNPAGLLVVSSAVVDGNRALAILKLEKESGVRVHEDKTADGRRTLSMEHIRELMLTDRTKVFKVGLFYPTTGGTVEGLVSDKQRGYQPQNEVADFFLKRFLGCALKQLPPVVTQDFLQATEQFINDEVSTRPRRLDIRSRCWLNCKAVAARSVLAISPSSILTSATDNDISTT
jgi:hypothetical protein